MKIEINKNRVIGGNIPQIKIIDKEFTTEIEYYPHVKELYISEYLNENKDFYITFVKLINWDVRKNE
jgi:hypothetical protein